MYARFTLDYELQREKMLPLREELTAYFLDPDRIEKTSAKLGINPREYIQEYF
jgi:hypothetical protein